jgi:cobalt-zinc-cadmium efflux system outer membrane protein
MNLYRNAALGTAVLLFASPVATTADEVLTLESVVASARTHAPAILSARARIEEARARVRGASLLRDNPTVDGAIGRRDDDLPANLDAGLSQTFELGGKRGARVAGARAALAREVALSDDTARRVVRQVAVVFFSAVEATERLRLARATEANAAEIARIAQRRHEQGDIAVLEVNVAESALARARAEGHAADAARASAVGDLRVLLGLDPVTPASVDGRLDVRVQVQIESLMNSALERADVRALTAELAEAEADVRLGKAMAWPDVSPAVRYERDDGNHVLWGGLSVTLPVFNRGQEQRALGAARAERIRAELAALKRAVQSEVAAAWEAYGLRLKAVDALQATVAALDENDVLARRSYEEGQIGLGELLLIRRETVDARAALLQRQVEAGQARVELETTAGVIR